MSWRVLDEPIAVCQWLPWIREGLSHALMGAPLDFRAATRDEALAFLENTVQWQPKPPIRWLRQTHSTTLWGLGLPDAAGLSPFVEGVEGDGFIFRFAVLDGSVAITTADCLPVIMQSGDYGALVHAGWRGLADGIVTAAALKLFALSGTAIEIAILPHASSRRYEVGEEVISAFPAPLRQTVRNAEGQQCLDLSGTARAMVEAACVPIAAWHDASEDTIGCTISHPLWHSHRRDGERSGRNGTIVAIG